MISFVLISVYNEENISLYNFKTGCVIIENLKCEHKGKKFVLQLHPLPVFMPSEEKQSYTAPKLNVNLYTVSHAFVTPCKQIKGECSKTFRVFVETFGLLRSIL